MLRNTAITAAALVGLASTAQAAVFDFNSDLDTTIDTVTTATGGITAALTTQRQLNNGSRVAGIAAIFDTENPNNGNQGGATGDDDLTEGFVFNGSGFGGALIISETETTAGVNLAPADDNGSGGSITFDFLTGLVNLVSFDILDDATITVESNGASESFSVVGNGNFVTGVDLTAFTNVSSVTFDFGSASGAIDNFEVNAVAPVPVPAALPMLLAGLGGLGLMRRRRKAA